MSFKSVKFKNTKINIIDGDRGENYPSQNEYLEDGYCLFLNAKNVTDSGFKFNKTKFITKEKDDILRKGKLEKEDVVLTTRGTVGNVGFFTNGIPYKNIRINSGMLIFRLENHKEFLPEYIYWYFRSDLFQNQIKQYVSGSAQPQLPVKTINEMEILKPDIEVQKKIVKIISSVNKKVLNNNKMNKTLEEIAKTIYKSWFVDFEPFQDEKFIYNEKLKKEIPKSFSVSTIGKELRVELGGTPLRREGKYWENGDINWIKSGKVNEFRIIEPSEYITQEGLENSSTVLLPKGTVVIAITGATLGQVSRLEIESCANQSVVGVVESNEIPSEYIYLWLLHRINVIIQKQTGGAQQHINKTNVKNSLLLLPPKKELNKFIEIVRPIFNKITNNCFENQSLKELRDSLLPKLMSGEIRVPLEDEKEVK
jgi:type I restriction enzyme S subunit